ncbi:MAG: 6-phosphogluconolactonase [Nitrospira sp. SB0678_bin_10]|nr:6-phosphogluconolactonase [Nitrospira sp. SB0678_bin_10]
MPSSPRDIHVYPTTQALLDAAAHHVLDHARQAIAARDAFTIALAGGSTPKGLFAMLAAPPFRNQLDWTRIRFFWGDERHVPPDHADSNYRMAHEALLRHLPISAAQVHRVPSELPDAQAVADQYEAALREQFGASEPVVPRFDLILLGMGPDGHTASLFPGTRAVHETSRLVAAPWVEALQAFRITFTPVLLNHARQVTFLICGHAKAETLHAVLEGPFQPDALPAQVIGPRAGTLTWFVDQEAGGALTFLRQ